MSGTTPSAMPTAAAEIIRDFGANALSTLIEGLAASGMAIAIFDPNDRLTFSGPVFREAFDVQEGEQTFASIMRHCHAAGRGPMFSSDNMDAWLEAASRKRRSAPVRKFEVDLVDGRWMWATEAMFNDGWILLTLQDFTTLKLKEIHLELARDAAIQAAETDPLTLLANRRAIMRYLDDNLRTADTQNPLAIALIDIDNFKQINDGLGHDTGDEVLRHFGRYCTHVFRNSDRVGRVGGEEFLLVMPKTDKDAAVIALQRFRHHLHRANQLLPERLAFTFSAGVAESGHGLARGDLYRAADAALYTAKAQGRDRIISSDAAIARNAASQARDAR